MRTTTMMAALALGALTVTACSKGPSARDLQMALSGYPNQLVSPAEIGQLPQNGLPGYGAPAAPVAYVQTPQGLVPVYAQQMPAPMYPLQPMYPSQPAYPQLPMVMQTSAPAPAPRPAATATRTARRAPEKVTHVKRSPTRAASKRASMRGARPCAGAADERHRGRGDREGRQGRADRCRGGRPPRRRGRRDGGCRAPLSASAPEDVRRATPAGARSLRSGPASLPLSMHSSELRAPDARSTHAGHVRRFCIAGVRLEVTLVAPGIVKVRRSPADQADTETASPAVLPGAKRPHAPRTAPADIGWNDYAALAVGTAGPLAVAVDRQSGLLTFHHAAPGGSGLLAAELDVMVSSLDREQRLRFSARREEHFYGLGQKVRGADDTSLSWRDRVRSFGPFGNAREKSCPGVPGQGNGNTTIPLLLSTAGYGLFLDNHFRHEWDFTERDAWEVSAAAGEHRYWFIYGPDPAGVLERYTSLTGRPPLPPRWALGLLQSKFGYRNWAEVHAAAAAFRQRGIPCDAIILDLYWFGGVPHFGGARRIGSLEWDPDAFPEPASHIAALARQGFRTMVIEEPYVDESLPVFREAAAANHLATGPDGAPAVLEKWWGRGGLVDMTSPAARAWWWDRHRALVAQGVAGWWADLGEPDTFDPDARYHGGAPHADVHNRYALEWARALHDGMRRDRPGARVFQLTRAGYAGIQRHGTALWSNDVMTAFEWLAPQPSAGINLGLSGVPYWGSDVGGFIGPVASDELYVRWFQFGAFSPVFRTHGQDRPTAPFEFAPAVERICALYARLRYRLLPYIYTAAREAYDTGMPLMRALACEFPDDPVVADLGAQYLFGPSLMVAPMVEPGAVCRGASGWTSGAASSTGARPGSAAGPCRSTRCPSSCAAARSFPSARRSPGPASVRSTSSPCGCIPARPSRGTRCTRMTARPPRTNPVRVPGPTWS